MALDLTTPTLRALQDVTIEPNIAIRIEGVDTLFTAAEAKERIRIGDDFLFVGGKSLDEDIFVFDEPWFIGGFCPIRGQRTLVDFGKTTFSIRQQINYDEAEGSSIQTMTLGLVDKGEDISELISPGQTIDDILGRKFEVFIGFGDTSFFEDYVLVFRGFCTSIDSVAGTILFKINHPDNKKNAEIFKRTNTKLTLAMDNVQTTANVESTASQFEPADTVRTFIRIDDEIMEYTTLAPGVISGITRGSLGTIISTHDADATVTSIILFEDNPLDLAVKLMISDGTDDPAHEDIEIQSFVQVGGGNTEVANAIYFEQINITRDFGLQIGDTCTVTGANNGANNFVDRLVTDIVELGTGFYIVVDGAALVIEGSSPALFSFKSQYNVYPDGLRMKPEEVDIAEHVRLRDFFFSGVNYELYDKEEEIEAKDFLDKQIYQPIACYSLPRKAAASLGYTIGPIPGENIRTINDTNVKNPQQVTLTRSTNRSFYNEVVYKYDDVPTESEDLFAAGLIVVAQDSKNRIPGTQKTFIIEAKGVRSGLAGANIAQQVATRIIDRYKFGAEQLKFKMLLRDSVELEIGDIFIFEGENLKVTDTGKGSRDFDPRLFEVFNKTMNLKTGDIDIVALDTGLSLDVRYGLMSPASLISGVISASQFVVGPDPNYPSRFGDDEFLKWVNTTSLTQPASIRVHNADYSVDEDLVLLSIDNNTFTLRDPATIALAPGLVVEFTGYVDTDTTDKQKLVWSYMTDDPAFPDGGFLYVML